MLTIEEKQMQQLNFEMKFQYDSPHFFSEVGIIHSVTHSFFLYYLYFHFISFIHHLTEKIIKNRLPRSRMLASHVTGKGLMEQQMQAR